mmetsp:Transcript_33384/g.106468  ORF Transcript_33384/g.106468 Transcript_33384/m.106468 type:complete len:108 (-) Transcript_33384:603-926(-)|eukprot:scaffold21923_cov112-Isochrysis_galbana.AAC.1
MGLCLCVRRRRAGAVLGAGARTCASDGDMASVPPNSDTDSQMSGASLECVSGGLHCDASAPAVAAERFPTGRRKKAKQSERYLQLQEAVGDADVASAPAAGGEEYVL